jgi:hypothetical protein
MRIGFIGERETSDLDAPLVTEWHVFDVIAGAERDDAALLMAVRDVVRAYYAQQSDPEFGRLYDAEPWIADAAWAGVGLRHVESDVDDTIEGDAPRPSVDRWITFDADEDMVAVAA